MESVICKKCENSYLPTAANTIARGRRSQCPNCKEFNNILILKEEWCAKHRCLHGPGVPCPICRDETPLELHVKDIGSEESTFPGIEIEIEYAGIRMRLCTSKRTDAQLEVIQSYIDVMTSTISKLLKM